VAVVERSPDQIMLRFTVEDTGIGMSPEQLARLFQEFSQADGSTTRKYGGTGLGLAIAKRIIELMAGEIHVESQLGAGSRFSFTARFGLASKVVQPSMPALSPPPQPIDFSGLRVLVVDDNEINRMVAAELMQIRGITHINEVENGAEALAHLDGLPADHYHVVMMDLQMPVQDGYETTRRLRADARYARLPIIAMTAHAMHAEREHCMAIGMNGYVTKPIEPEDLYAALVRLVADQTVAAVPGEPSQRDIPGLDAADGPCRATQQLPASLSRLRQLLADGEHDAVIFWREHALEFEKILTSDDLLQIGRAMDSFTFDAALAILPVVPSGAHE
jgi:CheY-like chemotaxis protein